MSKSNDINYTISKNDFKKPINEILISKFYSMTEAFECQRGEGRANLDAQKQFYNSLKQYCFAQGAEVISYGKLINKYASGYTIKSISDRKIANLFCWTEISKEKSYCLKDDKILFSFPKAGMHDDIFVVSYTKSNKNGKNIIQQSVEKLNKKQEQLKIKFKQDIVKYTQLINKNKINIISKSNSIHASGNGNYYFSLLVDKTTYKNNMLKFTIPFIDSKLPVGEIIIANGEEFTNKLLNRLVKKFSIEILRAYGNILDKDLVYSNGDNGYNKHRHILNIQFYSNDKDTNKFRYKVIAEISGHLENHINRECDYLRGYAPSYEKKKLEDLFENVGDNILNYKNIDCIEEKVFEAKQLLKIIIYDRVLKKVVYMAYVNKEA
jgi:hypothetical protein